MNMNAIKEHIVKNKMRYLLAIIVLAQIIWITYCFAFEKKGVHSDEIWSYSPATDSESMKFYCDRYGNPRHFDEWFSGNEFTEYLSIDETERFHYGYITENIRYDLHMPLYFWIIHTILSCFPNVFSWWFGFALNLLFFIVAQIYLYKLVKAVTGSDFVALCACLLYGFGTGGLNTYIYIRMYSMITALGIALFYYHYDLYKKKELSLRNIILCSLITYLGGITHIYALLFAGIIAALSCLVFFIARNYKKMFVYAGAMLLAAVLTFATFPYILDKAMVYFSENFILQEENDTPEIADDSVAVHDTGEESSIEESGAEHIVLEGTQSGYKGFWFEFRFLRYFVFREIFGITWYARPSYFLIHLAEALVYLSCMIPVCFLFRKEKWFQNAIAWCLRQIKGLCRYIKHTCFTKAAAFMWIMIATNVIYIIITVLTSRISMMGSYSTRYIFILYPYFYILILFALFGIIKMILRLVKKDVSFSKRGNRVLFTAVLVVFILLQAVLTDKEYYFKNPEDVIYLSDLPKEANYIMVLKNRWLIDCCAYEMQNVENLFVTLPEDLIANREAIERLSSSNPVYFLYPPNVQSEEIKGYLEEEELQEEEYEQKYEQIMNSISFSERREYVGITSVFGRYLQIFRIR
ncbi:MAG: hypothetical protein ACI4AQ_10175 [Lachnospiraceae bacterium]